MKEWNSWKLGMLLTFLANHNIVYFRNFEQPLRATSHTSQEP